MSRGGEEGVSTGYSSALGGEVVPESSDGPEDVVQEKAAKQEDGERGGPGRCCVE